MSAKIMRFVEGDEAGKNTFTLGWTPSPVVFEHRFRDGNCNIACSSKYDKR